MRKKNWLVKGVKVAGFGVLGIAVAGEVVAQLWNHLMPELFGAHPIGFWQALGLLVLSRIFFGGFRGRPVYGSHWKRRMVERWARMSPEQRDKFREGMKRRYRDFGEVGTEPDLS